MGTAAARSSGRSRSNATSTITAPDIKGRCDEPYVREEVIEQQFTDLLGRLKFDDEVLEWVREALDASHADERREHEEAIERLRAEYDRLQNRIHAMYVDKLDGKVDGVFFERMSGEWREEQDRCQREIERHQTADQSYLEEGCADSRTGAERATAI